MGPWPGIEPGLGEPQSPVLTPTPPQPSRVVWRKKSGISIIRLQHYGLIPIYYRTIDPCIQ